MTKTKVTQVQVSPVKSSSHSVSSVSSSNVKTAVVQQDLPQTGFHVSEPIVPLTLSVGALAILLGVKHHMNKRSDC